MVLEKTLACPLDYKEKKKSILKETNPEYLLEGLMLKLKPQYFDHLMRRANSLEKTLKLGKIEDRRRRFLRVSWTARRSKQSILKEISPEYSLEGLVLKLKL